MEEGKEITIQCSDGIQLAAKHWTNHHNHNHNDNTSTHRILCLHGWLDNASSFHLLAPSLLTSSPANTKMDIIALDFPGHGHSSHKSPDGPPELLSEYAFYVYEALQHLHWTPKSTKVDSSNDKNNPNITLVGHSMGAAVALLYTSSFPSHISKLILLDGAGPMAKPEDEVVSHLTRNILKRSFSNQTLFSSSSSGKKKVYPTMEHAIEARMDTARFSPGNQSLSWEAARVLVHRATLPFTSSTTPATLDSDSGRPVTFRHDPRLLWPSPRYYTPKQVEAIYRHILCPTCLLIAETGWPTSASAKESLERCLRPKGGMVKKVLPGSHHFHADPETVGGVLEEVVGFLGLDV